MDPLDEALGKLLSDPGAMAQVMSLAKTLGAEPPQEPVMADVPAPAVRDDRQTALFRALASYLPEKRRKKLERAMQIARLSRLAQSALVQPDPEE
ncbi:MAG: hypothetical protein IKT99_06580 [Oscillospiraceae bacterium]|nr:hypothetical protein [Oscillospiraceae bacterium]